MEKNLQDLLDQAQENQKIELEGEYLLHSKNFSYYEVQGKQMKNIFNIVKPNLTIDGSRAKIYLQVEEDWTENLNLFFIYESAKNIQLNHLKIMIRSSSTALSHHLAAIYNRAFGLKLFNCHIEMIAEIQNNLYGIYNDGNADTHLQTQADNLVIDNCFVKVHCLADRTLRECKTFGIYNYLANSISVQNNFIYSVNIGSNNRQVAIGIYTNGRFGRFVGNNIKSNGSHAIGKSREQASAIAFKNEGLYSLIHANNIIAEWAGIAIGLENRGDFLLFTGNKVLVTHTVLGKNILAYGHESVFNGNILLSTASHTRFFELCARECIITNNLQKCLNNPEDNLSSCGINAGFRESKNSMIAHNILKNMKTCGILFHEEIIYTHSNQVSLVDPKNLLNCEVSDENFEILQKLDENQIVSLG